MRFIALIPRPGSKPSGPPWRSRGDGTIFARRKVVCVLGHPDEELTEQDITNGALILAAPALLAAARLGRRAIDQDRHLIIEGAAILHPVTLEPDLATLDEDARRIVAELDAQLAQVDAAIALAGPRP